MNGDVRILLIGGTGFIGSYVTRDLVKQHHQVAVFQRGRSPAEIKYRIERINGDRNELARWEREIKDFAPDVVVDFILSSERQAAAAMKLFRRIASRFVALSSADVYRAIAVLHGLDQGPLQEVPLTEDSELRNAPPYGEEALKSVKKVYPWVDDEYDKIPVEAAVLSDAELPGTVLRLPMVYGPGDPLHRLHPYLKRMDDHRPAILLEAQAAQWRGPRGYVENVAAAIALAAASDRATGRIYNVAEPDALSEQEWVEAVARAANWRASIRVLPAELMPPHLATPYNSAQHWTVSSGRIRKELGYAEPVSSPIALERTIEWERKHRPLQVDPNQFDYAAEDAALQAHSSI